jgi:hypothetical protein
MEDLQKARQSAREAFEALYKPGPRQRTTVPEKAMYWLSIALKTPGVITNFDTLTAYECREVAMLCRRAHGPTTVSLRR